MKCFKFVCVTFSFLSVLLCFSPAVFSSEITASEVLKIAEKEKELFFGMIAFDYVKKYGSPKTSINQYHSLQDAIKGTSSQNEYLTLGNPFEIWTVSTKDIATYSGQENLSDYLIETKQWFVPVTVHGKDHAILTVGFMDEKWQVVGISMGDFGENIKKLPPDYRPGKKGTKFVRMYSDSVRSDFIAAETELDTMIMMTPYSENSLYLDKEKKNAEGFYDSSYVLTEIANKVRSATAGQN